MNIYADVAELVDAQDLKWVRFSNTLTPETLCHIVHLQF